MGSDISRPRDEVVNIIEELCNDEVCSRIDFLFEIFEFLLRVYVSIGMSVRISRNAYAEIVFELSVRFDVRDEVNRMGKSWVSWYPIFLAPWRV